MKPILPRPTDKEIKDKSKKLEDSTRMATYDGTLDDQIEEKFVRPHLADGAKFNRYRSALESIRDRDWVENTLDPQWAAKIAEEALNV